MRLPVPLLLVFALAAADAAGSDRVRECFEWGEYDSLLIVLDDCAAKNPAVPCFHHAYRGVALFAKGNIAGAREGFVRAIDCDSLLALDSQYVSVEMLNFFKATRDELATERARQRQEDSAAQAQARELSRTRVRTDLERERLALVNQSVMVNGAVAAAGFAACGVLAAFASGEYSSGKDDYDAYEAAAALGDRASYDRYRALIGERNRRVLGWSAASGACGALGGYFAVRAALAFRVKFQVRTAGGAHAITIALGF